MPDYFYWNLDQITTITKKKSPPKSCFMCVKHQRVFSPSWTLTCSRRSLLLRGTSRVTPTCALFFFLANIHSHWKNVSEQKMFGISSYSENGCKKCCNIRNYCKSAVFLLIFLHILFAKQNRASIRELFESYCVLLGFICRKKHHIFLK